jgi:Domain of unknown function (DUF4253)
MDNALTHLERIKTLSEKSGIEMLVIDEAEKITKIEATRFTRRLMLSSYIYDPIQSSIRQETPKNRTVELPGISFLVDNNIIEKFVDTLNKKLSYRQSLAFISNDETRSDKKQTISIIHSADKYNTLRLQETSGGSYRYSTDSIITKLQSFENKYPFSFVGVGDEWLLIKTNNIPTDWLDFAKEVLKVCPVEDKIDVDGYANDLKHDNGKVSMWWD